jgi:CheY-like chemotaxis protein
MGIGDLKSILVVDDNDTDLLIAKIVMEKAGFLGTTITKSSGKSALEYLRSILDKPNEWPNLIFLDINMPVVNGFGFIDNFEKMDPQFSSKVKIAILSSSDNKSDMERFNTNSSVIGFVPKPLSIDGFKSVIEKYKT